MSILYKDKTTGKWEKVGGIAITGFVSGLPDWDNAIEVTVAQINAGYTCPDNGLFVSCLFYGTNNVVVNLIVNGVLVATSVRTSTYVTGGETTVTVGNGDTVSVDIAVATGTFKFVPWKK